MEYRSTYQEGDIVGVEGGAMSYLSQALFEPRTRLYHFLVIGQQVPEENDYVILESIASGVRVGRLSWYREKLYIVFRVNDPQAEELGRRACYLASKFGHAGYDYVLYAYLLADVIRLELKALRETRRFRRLRPGDLPYHSNRAFICTEFANALWAEVGRPPIPRGVNPLPAGYVEAFLSNKIIPVGINIPPGRDRGKLPAYFAIIEKYLEGKEE